MPWGDREEGEGVLSSHTAWRAVIVVIALVLIAVIGGVVGLFFKTRTTIEDTQEAVHQTRQATAQIHSLSCLTGAFFVGQPVEPVPGQTHAEFVDEIRKAEAFLEALKGADCSDVRGAQITPGQIAHQLRKFEQIAPEGGGNQSGSPPGQPPGGGGHGHPPPPTHSGPPPGTTTTTPAPPPPTTTTTGAVRKICHLTRLGERICRIVGVP